MSTASRVGAAFVGVIHHPPPFCDEMSFIATSAEQRPFVPNTSRAAETAFVPAVGHAFASHASARATAW